MGEFNRKVRFRGVMRLAAVGATAAVLAGCSSDVSRLGAGPFSRADFTPTASIGRNAPLTPPGALGGQAAFPQQAQVQTAALAAPAVASVVESAPLAPPSMPTRPNFQQVPQQAAQQVPQQAAQQVRPLAQSAAATRAASSHGPWTAAGGPNVVVGPQESASVVAARYGVPMDALLRVNGLTSAAQVVPGARLTIPVFDANSRQTAAAPAPQQPARVATQQPARAASPQTQQSSQRQTASRPAAPATTQNAAPAARQAAAPQAAPLRRPSEAAPTTRTAETRKPEPARPAVAARGAAPRSEAAGRDAERQKTAQAPAASTQKPAAETRVERQPAAATVAEAAKPEFRWPARGRIIQGFKRGANDGIAISVPEGTPVKAAESGVVAYAGSELKGYGNLVLIRHPNGFVSAYAHNGELKVKRGETVRRGQTIARSGQTGNVSTPQLHFELRRGSTPVDPTNYLASL